MSKLTIDVPYGIGHIRFDNLSELQFKVLQSLLDNQKLPERRSAQMQIAQPEDLLQPGMIIITKDNCDSIELVARAQVKDKVIAMCGGRASGKIAAIQNALGIIEHRSIVSVWPQDDIEKANLNMPRPDPPMLTRTTLDRIQDGRADRRDKRAAKRKK